MKSRISRLVATMFAARSVIALVAILIASCNPSRRAADPAKTGQRLEDCADWQANERLSSAQKAVLGELHSAHGVCVQVWEEGSTVFRLTVNDAESGAEPGSTLQDHAMKFLEGHKQLWRLEALPSTAVLEVQHLGTSGSGDDQCHQVTFVLTRSDAPNGPTPVFNAGLRVSMRADGRVREVVGKMTSYLAEIDGSTSSASAAAEVVVSAFPQSPSVGQLVEPQPAEVVIDQLFLGTTPRAPAVGWLWRDRVPDEPVVLVNQRTLEVDAPSASIPPTPVVEFQCEDSDPTYWRVGQAWRTDTSLTVAQRARLAQLEQQSTEPFYAEAWRRAGTVYRIDLNVPSGLPSSASLVDHALAFVDANRLLWRLSSLSSLKVVSHGADGACSSVTLELLDASEVPVYGAMLRVMLTPTGDVRSVVGRVTGDPLQVSSGVTQSAAVDFFKARLNAPMGVTGFPSPQQVVFDPFFVGDSAHAAVQAHLWAYEATTGPGPTVPFNTVIAGATSPALAVDGPTLPAEPEVDFVCNGADPTPWRPIVVMDRFTGTPATVRLSHLGGVKTTGVDDFARALSLLERPAIKDMFGDAAPSSHLVLLKDLQHPGGGATVLMQQVEAGVPLEGGQVAVTLTGSGRALSIVAKFVRAPNAPVVPIVTVGTAAVTAKQHAVDLECGSDSACRSIRDAQPAPAGQLTLVSKQLIPADTLTGDHLTWKFAFPARTVYVDAVTNAVRLSLETRSNVHATNVVDRTNNAGTMAFVNGTSTGATVADSPTASTMNDFVTATDNAYVARYEWHAFDGGGGAGANGGTTVEYNYGCPLRGGADSTCLTTPRLNPAFFNPGPGPFTAIERFTVDGGADAGPVTVTSEVTFMNSEGIFIVKPWLAQDVVAHEWAHGIVHNTVSLAYACESFSLNESYADILAETLFPSDGGSWTIGETLSSSEISRPVPLRDMQNPESRNRLPIYQSVYYPQDPLFNGGSSRCPNDSEQQRYGLTGPPSKAAQLIADGFSTHVGLGRTQTHRFFMSMLADLKITNAAGLEDQASAAVEACRDDVTSPATLRFFTATNANCDLIEAAYRQTGLSRREQFGFWQSIGSGNSSWSDTLLVGKRLYRGCTLGAQTLRLMTNYGSVIDLDLFATPPQSRTVTIGDVSISVDSRGADSDLTDRSVRVHFAAKWHSTRRVTAELLETFILGPGVQTQAECKAAVGRRARQIYSAPYISHWDFFGSKRDEYAGVVESPGCGFEAQSGCAGVLPSDLTPIILPPQCELVSTTGWELWFEPSGLHVGPRSEASVIVHDGHGYDIEKLGPATSMMTKMHSWQAMGHRVSLMTAWNLQEQDGSDCVALINAALPSGSSPRVIADP